MNPALRRRQHNWTVRDGTAEFVQKFFLKLFLALQPRFNRTATKQITDFHEISE